MNLSFEFVADFIKLMNIGNAEQRLAETREVARRITREGVALHVNMDHAAIVSDPPRMVSGPLRTVGYRPAWDNRCYLSPVDNHMLALYVSGLPPETPLRAKGWFENVASVYAIDDASYDHLVSQQQGNPFIHHMTMGIVAPDRGATEDDLSYGCRMIRSMVDTRLRIEQALGEEPGNLIMSLPRTLFEDAELRRRLPELTRGLRHKSFEVEPMQGGGFLLQFFVLGAGRIEVAMRWGTVQAFNPASVERISLDEISVRRELLDRPLASEG